MDRAAWTGPSRRKEAANEAERPEWPGPLRLGRRRPASSRLLVIARPVQPAACCRPGQWISERVEPTRPRRRSAPPLLRRAVGTYRYASPRGAAMIAHTRLGIQARPILLQWPTRPACPQVCRLQGVDRSREYAGCRYQLIHAVAVCDAKRMRRADSGSTGATRRCPLKRFG